MIPTLSWALLKHSGFRSEGISSVASLLMADRGAVKGSRFRGNRAAGDRTAASRPQSDVTKTSKYSRLRANKKSHAFSSVTACSREVAAEGRTEENRGAGSASSGRDARNSPVTMIFIILLLGLGVGVLVGLLGIGGGVVLVPAMVYLLHMDQHMAQGTSIFILLPPIELAALPSHLTHSQVH